MRSASVMTKSIVSFLSQFSIPSKQQEKNYESSETELLQERNSKFYKININEAVQRVQENYFLERRSFL